MSYNDKKIAKILVEHCKTIAVRCPDYREQMTELLVEVLKLEREHALARTNITAKIGDQINALGMLVYQSQAKAKEHKR
jgi:hypothetical protein